MNHRHSQFTRDQPKDGEIVLVCAHICDSRLNVGSTHWFRIFGSAEQVERIDLITGKKEFITSRWIALCQDCFRDFPDPMKAVQKHVHWKGDDPVIKKTTA